jgi:oligopeptide/dipeptide ABC transporter ATP-binding protein
MITHDLAVLAQACERIAVMYAGQVVETGRVDEVYRAPQHPYTARLLDLLGADDAPGTLPEPIPGSQPRPDARPPGCRFHDRCAFAAERCAAEAPDLHDIPAGAGESHVSRCHFAPWTDGRVPTRAAGTAADTAAVENAGRDTESHGDVRPDSAGTGEAS